MAQNIAAPTSPAALNNRIGNVENVTKAVLWVGIISLVAVVLSLILFVIQTINTDIQSRKDLTESVQELNAKLDAQDKRIDGQ
jgi:sensor domain CHASE-containing protein